MDKIIGLLPLMFLSLPLAAPKNFFKSYAQNGSSLNPRGNYTFNELIDFNEKEFRIYKYDDLLIDEISDTAFVNTTIDSLVISDCVTKLTNAVFENAPNIKTVKYTGSKEEFVTKFSGVSEKIKDEVIEYAVDEGFLNYWKTYIRPTEDFNICSISQAQYLKIYDLYTGLIGDDLAYINEYEDLGGAKIKDSIKTLKDHFSGDKGAQKNEEWNQTGAITLIIFISVLGMTSITVFFLLKTKNIIQ